MPAENVAGSIDATRGENVTRTAAGAVLARVGYRVELLSAPPRADAPIQSGRTWSIEEMRRILSIR